MDKKLADTWDDAFQEEFDKQFPLEKYRLEILAELMKLTSCEFKRIQRQPYNKDIWKDYFKNGISACKAVKEELGYTNNGVYIL
jgi:hypothetical protein